MCPRLFQVCCEIFKTENIFVGTVAQEYVSVGYISLGAACLVAKCVAAE